MCSNILIFQCLTNQTGGKPKISPQLAVIAGFHSHQYCLRNFHRQHWWLENQLSQLFGVKFWVFYWFDLVWHCTNKLRYVLKNRFNSWSKFWIVGCNCENTNASRITRTAQLHYQFLWLKNDLCAVLQKSLECANARIRSYIYRINLLIEYLVDSAKNR